MPAVITALITCLFPVVVNVATGLATTEPELEDVMKALKATKFDILWNVGLCSKDFRRGGGCVVGAEVHARISLRERSISARAAQYEPLLYAHSLGFRRNYPLGMLGATLRKPTECRAIGGGDILRRACALLSVSHDRRRTAMTTSWALAAIWFGARHPG